MRRPSIKATGPLVKQIAKQAVEQPNDEDAAGAQRCARQVKADSARRDQEHAANSLSFSTEIRIPSRFISSYSLRFLVE